MNEVKKLRDSNFELLRILMMLIIVAHHYVVNSPIITFINQNSLIADWNGAQKYTFFLNTIFAFVFGSSGKMAINVFILISGYFMCKQEFRLKKVIYLCLQVEFYAIFIYLIFLLTGYTFFNIKDLYKVIFCIPYDVSKGFTGSFIAFYCLVPFINKFISILDKKTFEKLLITFFIIFCILPSFLLNSAFEYISWYIFVFLIGAYIRLNPVEYLENNKHTVRLAVFSLILSWISIIGIFFMQCLLKKQLPIFWFVSDSNKLLALLPAVLIFYSFKNWKIGTNKLINLLGGSTFGVFLIHASSDTMRKWIWQDICKNVVAFESKYFIVYALVSVICVFIFCVLIDIVRKKICKIFITKNRGK